MVQDAEEKPLCYGGAQVYCAVKRQHSLQLGAVCGVSWAALNSPRLRAARDGIGQLTIMFVLRARKQPPKSVFAFSQTTHYV